MKILMTGNPSYGLAQSWQKLHAQTQYHSRNHGLRCDLSKENAQEDFAQISLDFDVFINSSYIDHFVQAQICRKVWTVWKKNNKKGFIINIGSAVRDLLRPDNRFYPTSKRMLEDYSRQLYLYSVWGQSHIRVSCVSFGGIATPGTLEKWSHFSHLDTDYCAGVLNWVVNAPENCNVDLLQISPIQPFTKKQMKKNITNFTATPSDFLIADFDENEP